MGEDLSTQILSQTTENIGKLFDLSTRIDERVKSLQKCENDLKLSVDALKKDVNDLNLKIHLFEKNDHNEDILKQLQQCQIALVEIDKKININLIALDKRITALESSQQGSVNFWDKFTSFAIQIIWVIIAAWILAKLGLQSP